MRKTNLIVSLIILFIITIIYQLNLGFAEENFKQVPASIHISSTVSDGKLTISEIVKIARQSNFKIVILTDRDFMRWQYGLWPLRKIIRKTVERKSVFTYGVKRYLKEIKEVQKRNSDLVLIPGVESAPFYYWEGNPFKHNLKMYNWHKHMLVIGLEKASDYKNLPSVANGYSLALPFRFKDIYRLWPILILVVGILCLRKREFNYKDLAGHPLGRYSRGWRIFGIIVIIYSLLPLFNNFPFCDFKYDQYHRDQGIGPYQNFIDYVNQKGGLTFWAHPEAEYIEKIGGISIETRRHADNLLEAHNYTGFSIFYEGYEEVGHPGGIWDELLREYCEGKRKSPVWAIGGLGFDTTGDLSMCMKDLRTVFLIRNLNKIDVLKALKEGRVYVIRGNAGLILDNFFIRDSLSDTKGIVADEIDLKGNAILKISGHFADGCPEPIKINLIRNGTVIKTFEAMSPFAIDYQDDYSDEDKKIYYRLEIHYPGGMLITNPIFVNPVRDKNF